LASWEKFHEVFLWILRITYLNLLWLGFTILGLGIFGLFPATGALFSIVSQWFKREPVEKIFKTFRSIYRKEFFPLNKFGILFILAGYILFYDFLLIQMNGDRLKFLYPVILIVGAIYIITLLYFFPTYIRFDLKFFQYFKQSFLIAASSVLETMIIITALLLLSIIIRFLPGIIPFYTGSVMAVVITWCYNRAIERIKAFKENH